MIANTMNPDELEKSATASENLRVQAIDIKGLFRQYNHHIELQQEERVTILHGRNGVGKTVTLALVAALLRGTYVGLAKFPFQKLRIELSNDCFIEVHPVTQMNGNEPNDEPPPKKRNKGRSQAYLARSRRPKLEIRYFVPGEESKSFSVSDEQQRIVEAAVREHPWFQQIDEDRWLDRRDGEVLSTEELVSRIPISRKGQIGEDEAFRRIRKRVPVHFIEAQRLFKISVNTPSHFPVSSVISAVKDVAREMAARIKETDSTYRSTSTRLDDTLPTRLFAPPSSVESLSENELNRRTEVLEKERARLRRIGLMTDARTSFDPNALNDTQRAMFAVYLKDNEEKLQVFKDLADRVEILLGILNRKFAPKQMKLDKDRGYNVLSHDAQPLDLNLLSSGEQHELVLLHNLLFRVEPGALLLIDEPELSLHVTWQNEFLEDLILIAKKVGFDALVATHSPYIVGAREDLMVRLGEPV